jgi:hypothetical protein
MPLFVPENKGCLPMLRNGKTADELEVIAPRQYALITVGHTVNHKLTGNKNVILSDPIWGMDGKLTFNLRPKLTSKACTLCTDERSGRAQAPLYGAHDFSSTGFLKPSN